MQHARLIYRDNTVSKMTQVETSLYESNVTGAYILEQVIVGNETTRNSIAFGANLASELMPFLNKIALGEEV